MNDPPSNIPGAELDILLNTAAEAVQCANASRYAAGFTMLTAGLNRARQVGAGESWGPTLVSRWSIAVESYCALYGPKEWA